jgi:hypothetical protein
MRKADFAAAAMPLMPESRLALITGGRSDSPDTANNEGELEPTRSGRINGFAKKAGSGICRLRRCGPGMPVISACEPRKNGAPRPRSLGQQAMALNRY